MRLVIKILFLYVLVLWAADLHAQVNFTNAPSRLQLFARNSNDSADVVLSGQVTQSTYEKIVFTYYKDNVVTDSTIVNLNFATGNSSTNGLFNKTYRIKARKSLYSFRVFLINNNVSTRVFTADSVVCGDVFIINGQSNATANPQGGGTDAPYLWVRTFGNPTNVVATAAADTSWGLGQGTNGTAIYSIGVWGIRLAKMLADTLNIPICIINGARSGTEMTLHLPAANPASTNSYYGRLLYRAQKAEVDQKVKAIFWFQGESDGGASDAPQYLNRFTDLHNAWDTHYPSVQRIFVVQTHPGCIDGFPQHAVVRETLRTLPQVFSDIRTMTSVGNPGFDGCHFNVAGYQTLAVNLYRQVARELYNKPQPTTADPPDIVSVTYSNASNTEISLIFDQPVNWPAVSGGVNLKDYFYFDTPVNVVSGTAIGSTVKLTLAAAANATKITYIPNQYYNNSSTETYNGPWLTNNDDLGAFTFFEFPITSGLLISADHSSFCGTSVVKLTSNKTGTNYKWYFNGNQIAGANANEYNATQPGSYYHRLTDVNSTVLTSNTLSIPSGLTAPTIAAAGGAFGYCPGTNVALSTAISYSAYLWSNGQTTSTISVSSVGNFTVRVTNSQGCTAISSPVSITQYTSPVATINAPSTSFCAGTFLSITASNASSYLWSTGANTQILAVNNTGTYTVTITDNNGCTDVSGPVTITKYALPVAVINSPSTSFCEGSSLALSAAPAGTYLWSNGATTQTINTSTAATYTVIVTESHGCSDVSDAYIITKNTLPVASIGSSGTSFCPGSSLSLTASVGNSYLWSTGAITQSINSTVAGSFTVTVTDSNGCTDASDPFSISQFAAPTAAISSVKTGFCAGDSLLLTASSNSSYLWSTGVTTQNIYSNVSGTFTVTVTNSQGCSAISTPVSIAKFTPAIPSISSSGLNFCNGDSLLLTASTGNAYLWSTGQVTRQIYAKNTGSYSVFVTDTNGCTIEASPISISKNIPQKPSVIAAKLNICAGESLQLSTLSGAAYLWSTGETTASISISNSGNYTVRVVNNFGCSSVSDSVAITKITPGIPTISASNSVFCAGDSVLLSSSAGNSYSWSTSATAQNIYAKNSGSYSVVVTNSFGCSAISTAIVLTKDSPTVPTVSSGSNGFCDGDSVLLSTGPGIAYLWSNGSTAQNIYIRNSGSFAVTVTNNNGCIASSVPVSVTKYSSIIPVINSASTNFCTGDSFLLSTPTSISYLWSTGATTQEIYTNDAGTYTVLVIDLNGCSAVSAPVTLSANTPSVPYVYSAATSFCEGESLALTTNNGVSFLWSNGSTTQEINTTNAGIYTVTVTDIHGCSAVSPPVTITKNIPVIPSISSTGTSFCNGDSLLLTATAGSSYLWSTGSTAQSIYAYQTAAYVVTVTDVNGCIVPSNPASITKHSPGIPAIIANSTNYCILDSFILTIAPAQSYLWSTGETTQEIHTTATGTFAVLIMDINGCTAVSDSITLSENTLNSPIVFSASSSFCEGDSLVLTASAGVSYLWSNGATTQTISTDLPGGYFVTVTDIHGCSAISDVRNITKNIPSVPSISSPNTTFCNGDSLALTATIGNSLYLWSTGATTQNIYIQNGGNYVVTVTDVHGCSAASVPYSITKNIPPASIINTLALSFCPGDSMLITASSGSSYLWSTGSTSQNIMVAQSGSYLVTITDNLGCSAVSNSIVLSKYSNPTASVSSAGTGFCTGSSFLLSSTPGIAYLWSTGATTKDINITNAGSYTVTVTDNNGCAAIAVSANISQYTPVSPVISSAALEFCTGDSLSLSSSSGISYLWSTGSTLQNIYANNSGSYIVTVTDINGCSAVSAPKVLTKLNPPSATINAPSNSFCNGSSLLLSAPVSNSYLWSTGAVSQSVSTTIAGIFTVTVTDSNGCMAISNPVSITKHNPVNISIVSSGTNICAGDSLLLTASNGTSFLWSNGSTTGNIYCNETGVYVVTVADVNGCTGVSASVTVTKNTPTVPTISSAGNTFCNGSTLLLSSSAGSSYLWSNGATTQSVNAANTGTFMVTVTYGFGCSATSSPITVTKNTPAIPTINSTGTNFCSGSSLLLTASAGVSYLWSTGVTTQSINAANAGAFIVTVTNGAGCSAVSAPINISMNTPATPTISSAGTTFCNGSSLLLTASAGSGYLWSTGMTTQNVSATNSGTFTVTVTNGAGCTAVSAPITVTRITPVVPTISSAGTTFCNGSSLMLTSSAGNSYLWSTGVTTQSVSANNSGTFTVTVTNIQGCSAVSAPITVTMSTPVTPTINSAGTTFCNGSTLQLTATSGLSYLWSNSATTQSVNAVNSGTFTVTVTYVGGCSAVSAPITVTRNTPVVPTISSPGTTFCNGSTLLLTSSAGSAYLWSNSATTQSVSAVNSGTFTVTVTNSAGCSAVSAPITVTRSNPAVPTISSAGTTFCNGSTLLLTSSAGSSYLWSNNATTQSVSATNSGTFTVTVTNSAGCTAVSAPVTVTRNTPAVPTISSTGTTFCTTLLLTASAGSSYLWSSGGATTQSVTASNSGTFTVTVTNSSGCSAVSAPMTVTKNTAAVPVISSSATTFCNGDSLLLTSTAAVSYIWSNGATTQNIYTANAGTFSVTITNNLGCTGTSAPVVITRNTPTVPLISSSGTTFCNGASLLLTSSSGSTYLWSNGATTQSVTATNTGTFVVTVTNASGCSEASAPLSVTRTVPTPPTISSAGTSFCNGSSLLLTASSGSFYLWSTGATTQNISTTIAGNFIVTVTNSSGCDAVSSPVAITRITPAVPTISSPGTTFCNGSSLALTSSSGTAYLWSTGATTQVLSAINSGTYTVTVTTSGCTAMSAPLVITKNTPVTPVISSANTSFCNGDSLLMTSSSATSYLWSTGSTTQNIYSANAGTFTVTVTNSAGCSAVSAPVTITQVTPAIPLINSVTTSFCDGDSLQLTPSYGNTFVWSTGSTASSIYTLAAGTFTVTVTDATGCKAISTGKVITKLTNAIPTITGPATLVCEGINMTITSSLGTGYLWSTGATTRSISVNTINGYTVTVTSANLCKRKSNVYQANFIARPTGTISPGGTVTICSGSSQMVTASTAAGNVFQWYKANSIISGATLSTYSMTSAGTFRCRITNTQGCTNFTPSCTLAVSALPAATIAATNQSNSCIDTIVTLTANAGTSYTYKWQKSNVNIPAATSMVYNTASSGSYRAIVYNQFGCSRTSAALAIPIPIITASFTTNKTPIICLGDSVTLTANAGTGYLYQWQRNNANIAGATQRIFQAKVAGAYRVIVTNTMGCSAIAKSTTVTVNNCARVYTTGDEPGVVDLKFNIYPNPSMNSFTIENLSEVKTPVVFEIQDISGRVIKKGIIDFSEGNYHLGDDLLPGMYLFRVDAAGVRRTYRIEKIAD